MSRAVTFAACSALLLTSSLAHADAPSVSLWHAYRGDEERALESLAKAYEASHHVHIEVLAIPFEAYTSKLAAAVPHAHGPDLFIEAHERLGVYALDGLVAPVGDAFPDADVAEFDATSVRAITMNGRRFAVPLANKCLALYVNDALLPTMPASIDALAKLAPTFPEGTYPLAYEAQSAYFHGPFLHAFGGEMLDATGAFAFASDESAKSLAFVRQLAREHAVPEEPSGDLVTKLFVSGHAAAVISGPWLSADLKNGIRYHVEPLPDAGAGGDKLRPFLTVEGVFATPTGVTRPEARAFARWLGGEESALVRATVGRQIVARTAVWDDPRIANDNELRAFHEAAREAVPMSTSTQMRAAWEPANRAIQKVLRGDAEPKDALAEAKHRFDDATRPAPATASPAPGLTLLGLLLLVLAAFAVKRARAPGFGHGLRASLPAYKYVAHAALAVIALVILPLAAGALTSFFAGTRDAPRYVGLANYIGVLTARGGALLGHGSFYLTLLVTILWTIVNVSLHVLIGLTLGIALSRPLMRLKTFYRVILILPWAVPSYVTALAWKGMFHRQFGAINGILKALGAEPVSWFSHFSTAFAANVATNVWLGFPFMMVVTLGALTSIPKEVLEAASVDGASRWQRFRLVTLPLLMPALLPSVVLGSVWTFNMFNVVYLVSGGEPDGSTDILVSEAYRWAFTRDAQYGYAAAYAVLIFFLLAGGTKLASRFSGSAKASA